MLIYFLLPFANSIHLALGSLNLSLTPHHYSLDNPHWASPCVENTHLFLPSHLCVVYSPSSAGEKALISWISCPPGILLTREFVAGTFSKTS
ncbi:hypothetical protein L211DRAFT_563180 [Terfezia boudieri ATCC MYA-4762]|uniref:Secreted protein n=1 Tax=Terfezia boudieri ATCC MYA-4762 TaxID=1051890 RepID=A0A3N4LXN2_9PEZI|nr:hypothetical protein L211DRAFT_563180 [Terfezia boudieri ATCC MYA-4762]